VEVKEDGTFKNLEVELVRALNQRCHHCGNLGAGLMCKVDGCDSLLHFPCAALSGAFQNPVTKAVACFSHLESPQSLGKCNYTSLKKDRIYCGAVYNYGFCISSGNRYELYGL
jgi:ribosomal protein S27AE